MSTFADCPQSRQGEWSFRLFGVPIRVKFWFWIAIVLLGGEQETGALLSWVAVCFASILLHEFGHVWAFHAYGIFAEIVLYGFGGLAIPDRSPRGTRAGLIVALSGPGAGFCAAALALAVARASGATVHLGFHSLLPSLSAWPSNPEGASMAWYTFLNQVLFVNFYWGLVNLLPVYPLDGGHASRALFEHRDPFRGRRQSLILSAGVAAAVALLGLGSGSLYRAFFFGALAISSLQGIETARPRVPLPYRSPR